MLHLVLYVLLAIIVAVGLFLAATRFLPAGEQIAPAIRDEPVWELPAERSLRPEDVDTVRLPVALRGYRFAETDVLLDRLAGELRARDAEIARLRGPVPAVPPAQAEGQPEPESLPAAAEADPVTADPESPAADDDLRFAPPSLRTTGPAETDTADETRPAQTDPDVPNDDDRY